MTPPSCIYCGGPLSRGCDGVCIPCLRKQGDRYQETGDPRAFLRPPQEETEAPVGLCKASGEESDACPAHLCPANFEGRCICPGGHPRPDKGCGHLPCEGCPVWIERIGVRA